MRVRPSFSITIDVAKVLFASPLSLRWRIAAGGTYEAGIACFAGPIPCA
jgi:hypothetical protein